MSDVNAFLEALAKATPEQRAQIEAHVAQQQQPQGLDFGAIAQRGSDIEASRDAQGRVILIDGGGRPVIMDPSDIAGINNAIAGGWTLSNPDRNVEMGMGVPSPDSKGKPGGGTAPTEKAPTKTSEQLVQEEAVRRGQQNARGVLRSFFQRYFDPEDVGGLDEWAWGRIQTGAGEDELLAQLRERPEYEKRFPGMKLRRQNGLSAITEEQYVEYEDTTKTLFRAYGLPPGFYDDRADIADLLGNKDLSLPELQNRIEKGYARVSNAPVEVRNTFAEWYGPDGDQALAAFFLDPDKANPILERAVQVGSIGGLARATGINLARAKAERIFEFGFTGEQSQARLADLFSRKDLFRETITEGDDMALEEEGVDAIFGLDSNAENAMRTRLDERNAFGKGGGGAVLARTGTGFGSARS